MLVRCTVTVELPATTAVVGTIAADDEGDPLAWRLRATVGTGDEEVGRGGGGGGLAVGEAGRQLGMQGMVMVREATLGYAVTVST